MNRITNDSVITAAKDAARPLIARAPAALSGSFPHAEADGYVGGPSYAAYNNYDSSGRSLSARTVLQDAESILSGLQADTVDLGEMARKLDALLEAGSISGGQYEDVRNCLQKMAEERDASVREVFRKSYNVLLSGEDPEGDFLEDVEEHLDALEGRAPTREAEQEKERKPVRKKDDAEDKIRSVGSL